MKWNIWSNCLDLRNTAITFTENEIFFLVSKSLAILSRIMMGLVEVVCIHSIHNENILQNEYKLHCIYCVLFFYFVTNGKFIPTLGYNCLRGFNLRTFKLQSITNRSQVFYSKCNFSGIFAKASNICLSAFPEM